MQKYKLVVFVPLTHTDVVREAVGNVGSGVIGNYTHCSFSSRGIGRSKPGEGANPYIGEVGKLEEIEEERIEVTVSADVLDEVVKAMKEAHPYEEAAYDVYKLV